MVFGRGLVAVGSWRDGGLLGAGKEGGSEGAHPDTTKRTLRPDTKVVNDSWQRTKMKAMSINGHASYCRCGVRAWHACAQHLPPPPRRVRGSALGGQTASPRQGTRLHTRPQIMEIASGCLPAAMHGLCANGAVGGEKGLGHCDMPFTPMHTHVSSALAPALNPRNDVCVLAGQCMLHTACCT